MLHKLLKQGINIKIRITTFNTDLLLNAVPKGRWSYQQNFTILGDLL